MCLHSVRCMCTNSVGGMCTCMHCVMGMCTHGVECGLVQVDSFCCIELCDDLFIITVCQICHYCLSDLSLLVILSSIGGLWNLILGG